MNEKKVQSQMISLMTKSSLKSGRLRNIFVMVTIFLSVSLLCVILLFGAGSGEETKRAVSHMQHASYFELNGAQMDALKADKRISYYMEAKSGITSEQDGYSVTPRYVSRLSDKIQAGTLEEGRLPGKKNQAAAEAALLKRMGVEPRVGSTFEIKFYDGNVETFEVSGILKGAKANKNHTLLLSREYAQSGLQLADEKYALYVKISGAEAMGKAECKEFIYQIGTDAGIEYKYINPTKAFLNSLSADPNMLLMEVLIGAVILLACVLVIYGVFYISVIGRIHQFGQLRTLGMTKKQIKKLVKKEGSRLFLRAFPFGIIVGASVGYFVKPQGWSFKNALWVFLLVIAVNYIITMISVLKPSKIASNISPMEALRYTTQEEMKKEGSKKECRKLTPSGLGFMNFSKNRKKTVITMLSLLLGGILFMTAATYMTSFNKEQYSRQLDFEHGEFVIHIPVSAIELDENGLSGIQSNTPLSDDLKNKIENIPGVKKIIRQGELGVKYDYEKGQEYGTDDMVAPLTKEDLKDIQKHVVEGEADLEKLTSGDYVLIRGNDVVEEIYGWKFAVGDKITLHYYDGSRMTEREVEVLGLLERGYNAKNDGWFCAPEESLREWVEYDSLDKTWIVSTEADKENAVGEELKSILSEEPRLELETLQDRREMDKENISRLFGAVTGISIFIMMFSILSMMNTLITNIITRKQELAMLESIGMTRKQRRNMILGECFTLAGANILGTLLVGTGAGYLLCSVLVKTGASYMAFKFPLWFVMAYMAVLIIVPVVITIAAMRGFAREALTERLRGMEG